MKIQLNKNSWHFKYYSKVIGGTPPKTLCPYFWCMVALIVVSPVFLLFWSGMWVGEKFNRMIPKKTPKPKKSVYDMTEDELDNELERIKRRLKKSEVMGKIVMTIFMLFIVSLVVLTFYLGAKKDGWFEALKTMFSLIGLWSVMYFTIKFLIERNVGTKLSKMLCRVSNKNIIRVPFEMVKSFYTKTCPLINWN
jgi:hypothetical protein